jgi:hypothetical protein
MFGSSKAGSSKRETDGEEEWSTINPMKESIEAGQEYCIECEISAGVRLCNLCGDVFCEPCYDKQHEKGNKKDHTYLNWAEMKIKNQWVEMWDEGGKRAMWFNMTTKDTVYEKPMCLEAGEMRHRQSREARAKAEDAKDKAKDLEITRLQANLEALQAASKQPQQEADELSGKKGKGKKKKKPVELKKKLLRPLQKSLEANSKAYKDAKERERTKAAAALMKEQLMTGEQKEKELHRKEVFGTPEYAEQAKKELASSLLKIDPAELKLGHGVDHEKYE